MLRDALRPLCWKSGFYQHRGTENTEFHRDATTQKDLSAHLWHYRLNKYTLNRNLKKGLWIPIGYQIFQMFLACFFFKSWLMRKLKKDRNRKKLIITGITQGVAILQQKYNLLTITLFLRNAPTAKPKTFGKYKIYSLLCFFYAQDKIM